MPGKAGYPSGEVAAMASHQELRLRERKSEAFLPENGHSRKRWKTNTLDFTEQKVGPSLGIALERQRSTSGSREKQSSLIIG